MEKINDDHAYGEISPQALIKWLSYGRKLHICIESLPAMHRLGRPLGVEWKNEIHSCAFCDAAKQNSKGLNYCLRNKALSNGRALRDAHLFCGRCHMGLREIVRPVVCGGVPYCIVYIGNILLDDEREAVQKRLRRMARILDVDETSLLAAADTAEIMSRAQFDDTTGLAELLAAELTRFIHDTAGRRCGDITASGNWYVSQALDYINRYFYADLRLKRIADLCFINEQYLSRLISKKLGVSFTECLTRVRIDRAKTMLAETDKRMIEVALASGFQNVTYFNGVFKSRTGKTPREYRREAAASDSTHALQSST